MGAKKKKVIQKVIIYAMLLLITFCMVLPLLWLFSASLQGPGQIYQIPFHWIPQEFHWDNFSSAWKLGSLKTAFISSFSVSVLYICIHVSCCTLIGYVFAKYKFRFKNFFFLLILLTMMIPQELTFFPVYGVVKKMHLIDTYLGVVMPFAISGVGIFFMRQFCAYVPDEILEAARIDGCGHIRSFVSVALPLLKPSISALTVLAFSFIWDEFAWSKLVLNSMEKLTLPVTLAKLSMSPINEVKISELLAASVLVLLPVVILFVFFQKQFIESITQSGVKG